jgi:hypothetical protein
MNNKYFDTAEDALRECDQLAKDDRPHSEDRSTLSSFYNGRQTMTECEADDAGVSELTNHLFGYDSINTAQEQIFSMYSKSPTLFNLITDGAPDGLDQKWSMEATQFFNEAIKDSGRLKPEFKAFAGEVTLYGSFHFCYYDNYDWCPRARRPLAPLGTGIVPADGDYYALRDELSLKDMYAAIRREERLRKDGFDTGWKIDALKESIRVIEENFKDENADTTTSANSGTEFHGPTAEEAEINRQINATNAERYKLSLPVYYLYTSRPDEPGSPYDLTIIARYPAAISNAASKNGKVLPKLLFDKEKFFPEASELLHSFFIDCNIGGKTLWHRTMGLGQLNYDSDVDVEEFFNDAMQGSKENLRRQYVVSNAADTEAVNRWLSGDEWSNVIPDGVNVAEVAKNPNFQHAFTTMEMLRQLSRTNAAASISNSEGARATNELEVQALERQGRNAESIASRMNDIYDGMEGLGQTILGRFLNKSILPVDKGYKEIKFFQDKMKEAGIPLEFFAEKKNGEFVNVQVKPNRVAGDGNKVKETMVNRMLEQRLPLYSPQAQQKILRRITATDTQDYDLAEDLVPLNQEIDGGQINVANNENQSSLHRGLTGYVPPLNGDDIHQIHVPEHIGGLEALIAKGQLPEGWDEMDMGGFQSMLQHLQLHMQQLIGAGNKEVVNRFSQIIQGLVRQAQEFANNLQAKREAEQQQIEPEKMAKLQLEGAKLQLETRKQDALEEHRDEELDFKKEKAGVQTDLELLRQGSTTALAEESLDIKRNENQFEAELALEQEGAEVAREETLSGERSAQGAQPEETRSFKQRLGRPSPTFKTCCSVYNVRSLGS